MAEPRVTELLIAGQGAAGYAAAMYAARYGLGTLVVGPVFGGETALAGMVENYPGVPDIEGFELMQRFRTQVDALGVPVEDVAVTSVRRDTDCFVAELSEGAPVQVSAIILAVGRERRSLGLPHEDEWVGRGVSFCSTCDAPLYRGKRVAVVGGGDSAVEGALLNARHASEVYLIYRGDAFWRPQPITLELLERSPVHVLFETEVVELLGDDNGLQGVRLSRPWQGEAEVALDGLFVEIGAAPRTELAVALGVELDATSGEVHVDRAMTTNVPGVFAAGDVSDASGSLKQTVTAAAQGAQAALAAYNFLSEHPGRCGKHERGFRLD